MSEVSIDCISSAQQTDNWAYNTCFMLALTDSPTDQDQDIQQEW